MSSRFPDLDARAAWNEGARAWQSFVRSGADYYRTLVHGPALLASSQPVTDRRALDLGCGEGYFSRVLARAGARVVAADVAETLLDYARQSEHEEPLGIEYRHVDGRDVAEEFGAGSFDLVTACMSLQDMADPASVLRGAAHVLAPAGRMVFSVPHPCGDAPVRAWERNADGHKVALRIDRYFDTGAAAMEWNMARLEYHWTTPYWRRTIEEWTQLTSAAGLLMRRIREPRPTAEQVRAHPQLDDCSRIPYFLIFELLKA